MTDKFKIGHTATLKSGYLVKFSKSSGSKNARKRYVVLNGNAIIYYADHNSLSTPKGNLLIVGDSELKDREIEGFEFAFEVSTPFESLVLAARSAEDRAAWKYSISKSIEFARFSLRGYMIKKGTFLEGSPRKFFVLHNNRLSFHADHEHTALTQWSIDISDKTVMKVLDDKKMIIGVSDGVENVVIQFEARNAADYPVWKEALAENIAKFCELKAAEMTEVEDILETAGLNGQMEVRNADNDTWTEHLVALTDTTLYVIESYEDGNFFRVTDSFVFQSDSNVVATTLKEASFEVVTAEKILQVNAETREEADYWMDAIKDVIKSTVRVETDPNDSLFFHAQLKIPLDNFYEATFTEAKPLGVVLVKAGEWAFAKVANFKETGVKVGSALYSINNEPVWNLKYAEVVDRLKGWYPPLALGFRQAPEKSGFLLKKSTTKKNQVQWKKKFFVMEEGKLYFQNGEGASYGKRGEIALFGAAISLVKSEDLDAGHFYCFRVLSGLVTYTLEARDLEDMREWTAMLYHAIAFANGGAYIIAHDLELVAEEEERLRAMAVQEELERENASKERAELFAKMKIAVEERALEALEECLGETEACGMEGEFVEYAKKVLETLHKEEERRVEDEKQVAAAAAFEEEQMRLEGEMDELQAAEEEDGAAAAAAGDDRGLTSPGGRVSSLRLRQSLAGGIGKSASADGEDPRMEKMSAALAAIGEEEDDEDEEDDVGAGAGVAGRGAAVAQEAIVEPEDLTKPADQNDLKKFFGFYVKKAGDTGEAYINVMQFSAIWRVVTEEKGNLFKEMKMFNK